jgi:hypothetical protein
LRLALHYLTVIFVLKEAIMPLRRIFHIVAIATILLLPRLGSTQCVGIREEGRWRNLSNNGDPSYLEVKMTGGCGDQVLNGQPTGGSAGYTMWVWVKQPNGKFYGRPGVKTFFRTSKGQRWLRGNVPTGGYQDQMWLRAEQRNGQYQLHVFIKHQSLDSKPSAQSEYWFVKSSS